MLLLAPVSPVPAVQRQGRLFRLGQQVLPPGVEVPDHWVRSWILLWIAVTLTEQDLHPRRVGGVQFGFDITDELDGSWIAAQLCSDYAIARSFPFGPRSRIEPGSEAWPQVAGRCMGIEQFLGSNGS